MRLAEAIAAGAIAIGSPAAMAAPAGNAIRGEALYERCFACHSLETDRAGPRHCGLLGRRAGSVPGFDYSPAMRASGIVWSAETLDRFLAAPTAVVPGTSMGYAGIASAQERADLIAYLRAARCGDRVPKR